MATGNERRPGSQPERDWKGNSRVKRTFIVDIAPENVPFDGSVPGLPAVNSSHPIIPAARADLLVARELPGKKDWSEVDLLYSNDRAYGHHTPPIDPSAPGFLSWSISFQNVITRIPIARRATRVIPAPLGGAPTTQTVWAYGPDEVLEVQETQAIFSLRVVLDNIGPSVWGPIAVQNNRLHKLQDNRIYRYEAGDIHQTGDKAWETTHSWVYDAGTQADTSPNASPPQAGNVIVPPAFPGGFLGRLPFHQWVVYDDPAGSGLPLFVALNPYTSDLNGWQTLPGL